MKTTRSLVVCLSIALLSASLVQGCGRFHVTPHASTPMAAGTEAAHYRPTPLNLAAGRPNEAGRVPILEYHELVPDGVKAAGYKYPVSAFRSDIAKLYVLGYCPISLSELVTGHIICPAGKSPVVLTFDDALRGQLDYTEDGKIDPNCAVGILQDMHARHPDWAVKGTFFVIPEKGTTTFFYQKPFSQAKLQWLAANGFEIGNHTIHHLPGIRHWSDEKVQQEFASAAQLIDTNVPGYKVDLLALPYGIFPKNQKLVQSGSYQGMTYHNVCALLAGAAPAPSPVTKEWNPYRLQRIIPGEKLNEIGYWLDYLETHKSEKYVSDGDPNTVTVPSIMAATVVTEQLSKLNLHLRTY